MDQPLYKSKMERSLALDALRGMSILLMVLSGSIAFGDVLPAWMYHAQVPPPDRVFKPDIPGITWVDLVFPFFLFSIGGSDPAFSPEEMDSSRDFKNILEYPRAIWAIGVFCDVYL